MGPSETCRRGAGRAGLCQECGLPLAPPTAGLEIPIGMHTQSPCSRTGTPQGLRVVGKAGPGNGGEEEQKTGGHGDEDED